MRVLPLFLLASLLFSETPAEMQKRRRLEYPELSQLVDQVQSAPPEFAARAFLRIANAPSLRDKVWKRELIEQAFQTAVAARNAVKKVKSAGNSNIIDRNQMIAEASALGFDRLTLQTDAVKAMIAIAPRQGRELFLSTPQPMPAHSTCDGVLIDEPSSYFSAAAAVAGNSFTAEERKHDDIALFLNERVQRITSAVEVAPGIRMIVASSPRITGAQLQLLASSLAAAFQRIEGDDRAFSYSLAAISKEIASLSVAGIAESYRQFLFKNLTGRRCAGSAMDEAIPIAVADFNSRMSSGLAPLKLEDLKPSAVEEKSIVENPPTSTEAEGLRQKLMALLFGQGRASLTDAEKTAPAWKEQFAALSREIEGMKPGSGEAEALFFRRKGSALSSLLLVAPSGEARDAILQQYIAFLRGSSFQEESPVEWFAQVDSLAGVTRSMNGEYQKMLDALERSGNAVLALYAHLERALPIPPSWARMEQ